MQVAVGRRGSVAKRFALVVGLLVAVSLSACGRPASEKKVQKNSGANSAPASDARTQRNLQNALTALQPDQLGISSDTERAIAMLEEWSTASRDAEKDGQKWESAQTHNLLKSLPKEWLERATLDRFTSRDGGHIRDCLWANKAARFAGSGDSELDRIVNLFYFVMRNVELIPTGQRKVPLTPFDVMMLGRGTTEDRAWIFAELLRQRQIDSVILKPRSDAADAETNWLLVGVLLEKDIFLFDPAMGLPLPADVAQPRSALPRLPATLQQAQETRGLLNAIARDSGGRFTVTIDALKSPQTELISNTCFLSNRMRRLQPELSGELSAIVSDPLDDVEGDPGLWVRVTKHPAATWNEDDVVLWSYPERQLEESVRLDEDQVKEMARLTYSLTAPIRIRGVNSDQEKKTFELVFGKSERALMKLRMQHVQGNWPTVVQGYLAVQLFEVDPPISKDVYEQVLAGFKEAGLESSNAKRILRDQIPKNIRDLHLRAGNDACYWMALCQAEQNRTKATIEQCNAYLDRYSSGSWAVPAKSLLAVSLAKQKRWKDAIETINDAEEDSIQFGNHQVLIARWRRLMAEVEE